MKKMLSTLALAALVSPLSVSAHQAFTGITGGINAGIIQSQVRLGHGGNFITDTDLDFNYDFGNPRFSDISGTFGLTLGYASCFNPCFTWAIEGRVNFQDLSSSFGYAQYADNGLESFGVNANGSLKTQWAAIAKFGYLFSQCSQVYAFIGPQWAHLKGSVTGSYYNKDATTGEVVTAEGSVSTSNSKAALLVGLGFEQMINPCTSLALEYDYATYGRHNNNNGISSAVFADGAVIDGAAFNLNGNSHRFSTNSMLLKLTYYYA